MIGNRLEKEVIGIFNRDISSFLSINQISKKLKKAYPYINAKVTELIDEGVLNKIQIGRSYQCSINLNNDKAITLLTLNEIEKKEKHFLKIKGSLSILEEIKAIKKEFKVHTILFHDNSLIFVLDYLHDQDAIKNMFSAIKKFDLTFFDKTAFKQHISHNLDDFQDYLIISSYENYFEIINEIRGQVMLKKIIN